MATVPQQILDALEVPIRGAEINAWAPIGAAPGTSMGETHLLVTRDEVFALSRQRPWDALERLPLAGDALPALDDSSFETWLVLPLDNGQDVRVALTTHDRDAVDHAMAAIAKLEGEDLPPAVTPTPEPDAAAPAAAEPPAAAPTAVAPEAAEPPPAVEPTGAAPSLAARVDRALEVIELVGMRAGQRGGLNALDVTATVAYDAGNVELKVHYDRSTLARLAKKGETD